MNIKLILPLIAAAAATNGCLVVSKQTTVSPSEPLVLQAPIIGGSQAYIPKAVVYRMSGNATAANVPVQVNTQGEITSFPAPTDVKDQQPLQLANGYLLDRRGINVNSRFTTYTYAEYSALKAAPTPGELKAAIIPDASAIDIHLLDMTTTEALADTAAVNAIIRSL